LVAGTPASRTVFAVAEQALELLVAGYQRRQAGGGAEAGLADEAGGGGGHALDGLGAKAGFFDVYARGEIFRHFEPPS